MTDMPQAEQGGTGWAKTMHDDLGAELVRRWNEHDPMRAEVERLRAALRYISELDDDGEAPGLARAALEPKEHTKP